MLGFRLPFVRRKGGGMGAAGGGNCGAGPDPTLLYDTFTDADTTLLTNHTPEIGGPWVDLLAAHQIRSGYARRSGAANPPYTVAECNQADVNGTASIKVTVTRPHNIILRAIDVSNYWQFQLTDSGGTMIIFEMNAGVKTSRASATPTINVGSEYGITFSAIGNTLTFTVDGVQTISYTSALHNTATKYGIATNTDTNGHGINFIRISR